MKNSFYRIMAFLCIACFPLYWIIIFILAMPPNTAKDVIVNNFPPVKPYIGSSWRLFTPPHTVASRLYYIAREINQPGRADTIEVLENLSQQKQKKAPFNQQENIIDQIVHYNVAGLLRTVWAGKIMPAADVPGSMNQANIAGAIVAESNHRNYSMYLASLHNYGTKVLQEKNIDTTGREIKIIIKQKKVRPFEQMDDPDYVQKEILVFESPFKAIRP